MVYIADSIAFRNYHDKSLWLSRSRRSTNTIFSLIFLLEKDSLSTNINSNFNDSSESKNNAKKKKNQRKLHPSIKSS